MEPLKNQLLGGLLAPQYNVSNNHFGLLFDGKKNQNHIII